MHLSEFCSGGCRCQGLQKVDSGDLQVDPAGKVRGRGMLGYA
jgi:hypothetical protein